MSLSGGEIPPPPAAAAAAVAAAAAADPLRFQPLRSAVHISFWQELSRRKLEVFRLSTAAVPLAGRVQVATDPRLPSQLEVSEASFAALPTAADGNGNAEIFDGRKTTVKPAAVAAAAAAAAVPSADVSPVAAASPAATNNNSPTFFSVPGELHIVNTREQFKVCDKRKLLADAATRMWGAAHAGVGGACEDPRQLCRFVVLIHADLKKHKFLYWFGFPAITVTGLSVPRRLSPPAVLALTPAASPASDSVASHAAVSRPAGLVINEAVQAYCDSGDGRAVGDLQPFCVLRWRGMQDCARDACECLTLKQFSAAAEAVGSEQLNAAGSSTVSFCFFDSSPLEGYPGWLLRNFLMLVRRCAAAAGASAASGSLWASVSSDRVSVCALRLGTAARSVGGRLPQYTVVEFDIGMGVDDIGDNAVLCADSVPTIGAVGWEHDRKGRPRPRQADLQASMDPRNLARVSVDLNVKLMRWRMLPELDTGMLQSTRCLLLGAGTLGCNVARALMGWGVRRITFVDNGTVSYSNPVRQSLFRFEDCADGGKPKAQAAADELKRIFPDVDARAVRMNIPMPGHIVSAKDEQAVRSDVAQLEALVAEHDCIFLLTDTRESRWLPTLLGTHQDKIVINIALGFDSFLVMRHGTSPQHEAGAGLGAEKTEDASAGAGADADAARQGRLGCYFCNDIVAPGDSTRDRTLDQQCTVTRPGLALMASAMGVELMIGLLHHPLRNRAPADEPRPVFQACERRLGLLPHQIRGYLTHYANVVAHGPAFQQCTACSPVIQAAYRRDGFSFLHQAFNEPTHLEDLSGITALNKAAEDMDMDDFALSDSDDEGALM